MNKHLYEYFNYNSQQELLQAVKKDPNSIPELNQLFQTLQEGIANNRQQIGSSNDIGEYINNELCFPKKDSILIMRLNTKNEVLGHKIFNGQDKMENTLEAIKYVYTSDTVKAITITQDQSKVNFFYDTFKRALQSMEIELVEQGKINRQTHEFTSDIHNGSVPDVINDKAVRNVEKNKEINKNWKQTLTPAEQAILNSDDFKNVKNNYVENNIRGLDIIKEEVQIEKLLKLDLQEKTQEYLYVLSYDHNYKIKDYDLVSIGTSNRALVEPKAFEKYFKDDSVSGISLVHNHPSGTSFPSRADVDLTNTISYLANIFDKNLYEHYVVATRGVSQISVENDVLNYEKSKVINRKFSEQTTLANKTNFLIDIKGEPQFERVGNDFLKCVAIKTEHKEHFDNHTLHLRNVDMTPQSSMKAENNFYVNITTKNLNNIEMVEFVQDKLGFQWLEQDLKRQLYKDNNQIDISKHIQVEPDIIDHELTPAEEIIKQNTNEKNLSR